MRIFSRIRSHQSIRETINRSLWRRKTKPTFFSDFTVVVLVPNKICGAFPWQVSVFSVLRNTSCFKTTFRFSTNIPAFVRYIGWPETNIFASSKSVNNSSIVFFCSNMSFYFLSSYRFRRNVSAGLHCHCKIVTWMFLDLVATSRLPLSFLPLLRFSVF